MKPLGFILILLLGGTLVYTAGFFPDFGDPHSPASEHLSPHYIEHTLEETSVPNIVTAVLADYRGYDTMFETTVVFCAALACFFLLRVLRSDEPSARFSHPEPVDLCSVKGIPEGSNDFIVGTIARLIVPFIQLYALYVIAHGHHSPGGGFQGGVILGASFILLGIAYDLRTVMERFRERAVNLFLAGGVFIYAGIGATAMLYNANFLDYSALHELWGVSPVYARSLGILFVEVGVALTVMATMILIYNYIASRGGCDEGL